MRSDIRQHACEVDGNTVNLYEVQYEAKPAQVDQYGNCYSGAVWKSYQMFDNLIIATAVSKLIEDGSIQPPR